MKPNQKTSRVLAITLLAGSLFTSIQAHAGVVVIVNAENPTTASTDIKRIMLGRLNQFPGDGPSLPVLRSTRWEHWPECAQKGAVNSNSGVRILAK